MMSSTADWTIWGLILLVGFPLLIIVLGELLQQFEAKDPQHPYRMPVAVLRNGVLPLAFIDVTLREIAGLGSEQIAVKIADTGLWIVTLNAGVAILNNILFREDAQLAGRLQIPRLLLDLLRLLLVLCGSAIVVSRIWGFDLSSLIAALGVGSVVIGLALQDTLGSVFAGIALVSNRQFRVGDWIKHGGDEGLVLAMNWRAVKIRTRSGDTLFVPNGIMSKAPVQVIAAGADTATLGIVIRMPSDVSPDRVMTLMNDVACNTRGFHLIPPPSARLTAIEDKTMSYAISIRAAEPQKLSAVRSEYLANLWFGAKRQGLPLTGDIKPDDAEPTVAGRLEEIGAFKATRDALEKISQQARTERYRINETIVPQGVVAGHLYVIASGRAIAVYDNGEEGEVPLHAFEPGQMIMAKALFQGAPNPYTFRAATELEVIALPIREFKDACLGDATSAHEIEQILTARDEAANRVLATALPELQNQIGLSDRVQLMREMFRS